METKLARIAQIAKERPKEKFTSLAHLIDEEMLLECHKELSGNKATGVDEVTKDSTFECIAIGEHYNPHKEDNNLLFLIIRNENNPIGFVIFNKFLASPFVSIYISVIFFIKESFFSLQLTYFRDILRYFKRTEIFTVFIVNWEISYVKKLSVTFYPKIC